MKCGAIRWTPQLVAMKKIARKYQGSCIMCENKRESLEHYLLECEAFDNQRREKINIETIMQETRDNVSEDRVLRIVLKTILTNKTIENGKSKNKYSEGIMLFIQETFKLRESRREELESTKINE
jgi:hypothetical protein